MSVGIFFWIGLLLYKYYSLAFYDWDLAFFSQAMWCLSHGSTYVSLFDTNFFANHANLIAYFLVPVYKVFPHPFTLLVFKLVSFFGASYFLYLIAKEKLGERPALIILLLYYIYAPNIYGLCYEFDFENLAPIFIMLIFYYYKKEDWIAFLISGIFLILIKENLPLIICAYGIHGFLTRKDKIRWGIIPFIIGALSFLSLALIFVPLMAKNGIGQHPYMGHYSVLINDTLKCPRRIFGLLTTVRNWKLFGHLFAPLMFLPLLSPGILFLAAPIFLQHLLSNSWQEHSIAYGYTMTVAPFVFLAFISTLAFIKQRFSKVVFSLVLLVTVCLNMTDVLQQMKLYAIRYMDFNLTATAPQRWQLLKMVPPQSPVIATFNFLPPLSQRSFVYAFHKMYDPEYQNERWSYQLPESVHYALIDFNDSWLKSALKINVLHTKVCLQRFFKSGHWVARKRYGTAVLYQRRE